MPRFYFHVGNGSGFVEDDEGREFADLGAAKEAAVDGLRDILAGELRRGDLNTASFIEIENEEKQLVATVSFEEVVRVTNEVVPRRS